MYQQARAAALAGQRPGLDCFLPAGRPDTLNPDCLNPNSPQLPGCLRLSPSGMSYGDGTITNADVIRESGISDPSSLFQHMPASSMGKLVLSPHVYPGTLTGKVLSVPSRSSLLLEV